MQQGGAPAPAQSPLQLTRSMLRGMQPCTHKGAGGNLGCRPPIMREVPSGSHTMTTSASSFSCSWMAALSCSGGSPIRLRAAARRPFTDLSAAGTRPEGATSSTSCAAGTRQAALSTCHDTNTEHTQHV